MFMASPPASARRFGLAIGDAALARSNPNIFQRAKAGKTATECREALGVRGACSRFGARWVARKRQQAGRTPDASRGSQAERHSRSKLRLKGPWLFALPLAPGSDEPELELRRKGGRQKIKIALCLRQQTTMTLAWVASRLKMGTRTHSAHLIC